MNLYPRNKKSRTRTTANYATKVSESLLSDIIAALAEGHAVQIAPSRSRSRSEALQPLECLTVTVSASSATSRLRTHNWKNTTSSNASSDSQIRRLLSKRSNGWKRRAKSSRSKSLNSAKISVSCRPARSVRLKKCSPKLTHLLLTNRDWRS
jgi:hypothetical protein